jgi:hypothetical protein
LHSVTEINHLFFYLIDEFEHLFDFLHAQSHTGGQGVEIGVFWEEGLVL